MQMFIIEKIKNLARKLKLESHSLSVFRQLFGKKALRQLLVHIASETLFVSLFDLRLNAMLHDFLV